MCRDIEEVECIEEVGCILVGGPQAQLPDMMVV